MARNVPTDKALYARVKAAAKRKFKVWFHAAATRHNGLSRVFLNGVPGTPVVFSNNFTANDLRIGGGAGGSSLDGYIDDFRITKGVARYTTNFTPQTAPFPDS